MAYVRTNWENREVEKPRTYTRTENADGTITLTPAEGEVFVAGTPIVAENMNNIENQLVVTDNHMVDAANPHQVTAEQVGAYTIAESDSFFQPKMSPRRNAFMYTNTTVSYGADTWSNVYFENLKDVSGATSLSGYGVEFDSSGYYLINVSLSLGNFTTTTGHVLLRVDVGMSTYRLGAQHFNSGGNLSVGGSVVTWVTAGEDIKVYTSSYSGYDVIGVSGEYRSYCGIRELL